MSFFSKLFSKKKVNTTTSAVPSFDDIVEMMFDKRLSFSDDLQVINVFYNKERTKRFILLKSINGYYKYTYEELCVYDEEEWMYVCNQENSCPACWAPRDHSFAYSFFGTEKEALSALVQEPEYGEFFINF